MKRVRIINGSYGKKGKCAIQIIRLGQETELEDEEAERLVDLGVAEIVESVQEVAEVQEELDEPQEAEETAHLDPEEMSKWTKAQLLELATDLGLATAQLKTKQALVDAICAQTIIPGEEEAPILEAEEPVQ